MKLIQLFIFLVLFSVGLQAQEYDTAGVSGKSRNKLCQNIKVTGAYAEAAKKAKEQDVVGNLAKTRESVEPSLDDVWKKFAGDERENSDAEQAEGELLQYGMSLQFYVGIPLLGFVLSLLIYPVCCSCHLCANCVGYDKVACCCCPPKRDDTYSSRQQTGSCAAYLFFALGVLICTLVGITGGNTFGTGLLEMSCQFDGMRATGKNLFQMLLTPADKLVNQVDGIVNATNVSMVEAHKKRGYKYSDERLTLFTDAITELSDKLDDVKSASEVAGGLCLIYPQSSCPPAQDYPDPNSPNSHNCPLCYDKSALDDLSDGLEGGLRGPSESIKSETNAILTHLIGAQGTIKSGVGGVKTSLKTVTSFMDEGGAWHSYTKLAIQNSDIAKRNATYAFGLPYGLIGFGVVLTCVGFILMKVTGQGPKNHPMSLSLCGRCGSCCVGLGWNLTCCTMLVFFLLCTILWPVMYVFVDTCVILQNKFPNSVGSYLPVGEGPSKMIQACFTPGGNTSFIPEDLLSNFDFSEAVTFDSAELSSTIDDLFDALPMGRLRNEINNMTNFSGPYSNDKFGKRAEDIMEIKALMENITATEERYKAAMKISIANIGEISNITKPLFSFTDGLMDDFSCLAVGDEYRETADILCGSLVPGMSLFIISMLLTAILGCPLACSALKINQRMGGHGLPRNWELYEQEVELTGFPMSPDSKKGGYV